MTNELLFDAFSHLDDDLLERSETRAARRSWLGVAACFVLLAAALIVPRYRTAAPPALSEPTEREWDAAYAPKQGETDETDAAPDAAVMGPAQTVGEPIPTVEPTPMIESYPLNMEACYAAPQNGEVGRSVPLRAAMDEYGGAARYRVIVEIFRDGQPLPADGEESAAERERLAGSGYTVAYETLSAPNERTRCYFTLHATHDQLEAFPADAGYGYMLFLYGEREKSAAPAPVWYGAPQLSTGSVPMDSVDFP